MMVIDEFRVEGEQNDSSMHVVYVKFMGNETDGEYVYHMYLSDDPDSTYNEEWGSGPAGNVPDRLMDIDDGQYQHVVEIKSSIILDLARHNTCFTMQDCRDHIVALAYENIDGMEEYPEPRIIMHFGDSIDDVEKMFARRDIPVKYLK